MLHKIVVCKKCHKKFGVSFQVREFNQTNGEIDSQLIFFIGKAWFPLLTAEGRLLYHVV